MTSVRLGFIGAHRSGKTTLAEAIALRTSCSLVKTQVSDVLWIQQQIIQTTRQSWQLAHFVTDRTPIDFMAYTLADIQGETIVDIPALETYLTTCFEVTNQIFTHLILVQPGIPLVYAPGKAALNKAYIEHLNTVMLGLCHDPRLHCPIWTLKRQLIHLEDRIQAVLQITRL